MARKAFRACIKRRGWQVLTKSRVHRTCDKLYKRGRKSGWPARTPLSLGIKWPISVSLFKRILSCKRKGLIQILYRSHHLRSVLPKLQAWRQENQEEGHLKMQLFQREADTADNYNPVSFTFFRQSSDINMVHSLRDLYENDSTKAMGGMTLDKLLSCNRDLQDFVVNAEQTPFPGVQLSRLNTFLYHSMQLFDVRNVLWKPLVENNAPWVNVLTSRFLGLQICDYDAGNKLIMDFGDYLGLDIDTNPIRAMQVFRCAVCYGLSKLILEGNYFDRRMTLNDILVNRKGDYIMLRLHALDAKYTKIRLCDFWGNVNISHIAVTLYERSKITE